MIEALTRDIDALERKLDAPSTPAATELAQAVAQRLLEIGRPAFPGGHELVVRGLLAANHQVWRAGQVQRSREILRAALACADGCSDETRIGVLLRVAEQELLAFDIAGAMGHTAEAMDIAHRTGRRVDEARARANYALALDAAGIFAQADAHWQRALDVLEGLDEPRLVGNIWLERCPLGFRLQAVAPGVAEQRCDRALEASLAAPARYRDAMVATALANGAALDLQQGRVAQARERIERALALPNLGARHLWLIDVLRVMSQVRERNDDASRALLALLFDDGAVPPVFVIEAISVLAAMYADMGDAKHAGEALARLSVERSKAMWQMLRAGDLGGGAPGGPGATPDLLVRLAVAAELRDDATGRHCFRVGRLARLLGQRAGLATASLDGLELAARLHDIGKLAIPDGILLKVGRLDDVEHQLMRTHSTIGEDILVASALPGLEVARAVARHHHERWDGHGYPDGLAGEAIPVEARVAAIADVYDALTHVRPYKRAWSHDEAMGYIATEAGTHLDPALADLFAQLMAEVEGDFARFRSELEGAAAASAFVVAQESAARLAGPPVVPRPAQAPAPPDR